MWGIWHVSHCKGSWTSSLSESLSCLPTWRLGEISQVKEHGQSKQRRKPFRFLSSVFGGLWSRISFKSVDHQTYFLLTKVAGLQSQLFCLILFWSALPQRTRTHAWKSQCELRNRSWLRRLDGLSEVWLPPTHGMQDVEQKRHKAFWDSVWEVQICRPGLNFLLKLSQRFLPSAQSLNTLEN